MWRRLAIDRLGLKLGLTVTLFVVAGLALGFHLTYRAYRSEILAAARAHAESEARLVRLALSHQMLESDDRTLIRRMVRSFAGEAPVERVMVLDRDGQVQFSSDPAFRKDHFAFTDDTCQVCHQHPPEDRQRSTVLDLPGGTVLRAVQPIPNDEPCHECHDPEDTMNGVLIVDVPVSGTFARMESSLQRLALGTAAMALVLITGIGLAFRRFVLRRIRRFEKAALALAQGDMAQRVPVEGNDALTRVELQFNRMADSVGELLRRMELQRERLRRVMNSVDDGMVVLDPELRIVAANDAFVRRFPLHGAGIIGRTCMEVVGEGTSCCSHPEDCPARHCFATRAVQTGIRTREAPEGPRQEEVRASPFVGEEGDAARVVEVWRDITDRRSAEARLAEYQRMASVGMLASGFSHEVNTPLSSIGTCIEAIEGITADEDVHRYTRIASEQVQRAAGITRQFLDLARGGTLDREILDLGSVASHVARLAGPTARLAGVAVEVLPQEGLPAVLANGGAVQQVLLNLILNAVEASDRGTCIRIGFRLGADTVDVLVADEGHGMEPGDVARIFEPFFTRRAAGTGLGLFVSVNLARGWSGDVRVDRTSPGAGTTFAVTFPRDSAARTLA